MTGAKLSKCKGCGRPFLKVRESFCVECLRAQDEQFEEVTRYLRDNPGSDAATVAAATGVSPQLILSFVRSGRLDTSSYSMTVSLNCQGCGKSITSGTHCDGCSKKIAERMQSASAGKGTGKPVRQVPKPDQRGTEGPQEDDKSSVQTGFFSYGKKK